MAQASRLKMAQAIYSRFTLAEVNAGETIVAAEPGIAYRIVDVTLIAVGGAAATGTSVDIIGTRSGSEVRPIVAAVAALTEDAVVKPDTANVTVLAAGASFTLLDENTAITIGKQSGGSNIATSTHFDVILTYTAEEE